MIGTVHGSTALQACPSLLTEDVGGFVAISLSTAASLVDCKRLK